MEFLLVLVIVGGVVALVVKVATTKSQPSAPASPLRDESVRATARVRTTRQRHAVTFEIVIDDGRGTVGTDHSFRTDAESFWKPFSMDVDVHGYRLGGGIYVGQHLRAAHGWGLEPALIDEKLPVDRENPNRSGEGVGYWPSYSDISPAARAGYLEWLSQGRSDPDAYIGYVFLYFYGLERRYFLDSKTSPAAKAEGSTIEKEVERLLSIYASNGSFNSYATRFLDAARVLSSKGGVHRLHPAVDDRFGMPLSMLIGLGEFAASGRPLPAEWALAWLRSESSSTRRRAAERCKKEFDQLFSIRYTAQFGQGIVLTAGRDNVTGTYRAASASLREIDLNFGDVPDVSRTPLPTSLEQIADDCANDLEAFSRWLGKNPDGRTSVAAIGLLPVELATSAAASNANRLVSVLESHLGETTNVVIATDDLLLHWPTSSPSKLKKAEAVLLCQALQKMGYGIEPDVRFGGQTPEAGDHIVLFRIDPEAQSAPSGQFASAATLLQLAAIVSGSDEGTTVDERRTMEEHLADALLLSDVERTRLGARLEWLIHSPVGTAGLKKQIEKLPESERATVGTFLVSVATADGRVSPGEVDALRKVYKLLGLSPDEVYGELHASSIDGGNEIPVSIVAEGPSTGFRIPQDQTKSAVALDASLVERKLAETAKVSALLSGIFSEDEEDSPLPVIPPSVATNNRAVVKLGLHHAAFMQALATRAEWRRAETEQLAADVSLLLDGALEKINDFAFDETGQPFWEGDDIIQIDEEVARRLTS
jgi:tellurite resistance protein